MMTVSPAADALSEQVERLDRDKEPLRNRSGLPLWAIFTENGTPVWFGPEPVDKSDPLDLAALAQAFGFVPEANVRLLVHVLAAHRRLPNGSWVKRTAPAQVEPTEAEKAVARAEAAMAAAEAEAERQKAIDEEVFRRSGPDQLLRMGGRITIAEFNARLAAIRAEVEARF